MTAISIAAGTSMMQHRTPVSPSRGCPFLVDSVTGSVCGKEQRQIATVDGLMYCNRHAKMTDGDQVRVKEEEKFCPVCREEGRLTPARTELIYAGMCKRHTNLVAGGHAGAKKALKKFCSLCSQEGRQTPAQTKRKYGGMCKRHAKTTSHSAPHQRALPTCFAVCSRPLRHLWQMRHFSRSARAKRNASCTAVRRTPAPAHVLTAVLHGQRHARCAEIPCAKRARVDYGGERYCKAHVRWRSEFGSLKILRSSKSGKPPDSRSPLAHWVLRQEENIAQGRLTVGQKMLLESIPRWRLTSTEFRAECRAQRLSEAREVEAMRAHDVDFEDAKICYAALLRDQDLVRTVRDVTPDVPYFYLREPRVPKWDPHKDAWSATVFQLPFPLGIEYQRLLVLPSDFSHAAHDSNVDAEYSMRTLLGQQRIAYHVARSSLGLHQSCPQAQSRPWRPITFEEFARSYPAQTLLQLYYEEQHPSFVIGQQAEFVKYLKELGFMGRIWRPAPRIIPHLHTAATAEHVRFDSACRLGKKHSDICRRHCCVCGLNADEAAAAVRTTSLCWPRGTSIPCLCTPSALDVLGSFYPAFRVCGLDDRTVLHWSTALGLTPLQGEQQHEMRSRGYLLLQAALLTRECLPNALDAIRTVSLYGDDYNLWKFTNFASSQNITRHIEENLETYLLRAAKELHALYERLKMQTITAAGAIYVTPFCLMAEPGCKAHDREFSVYDMRKWMAVLR